jgi:tRNA (cmo5U34)-methyltransferase
MNKDTVYARPRGTIGDFQFDARVADVFENMISRSVPGYGLMLELVGLIADIHAAPNSNCYDLGCSLGASTLMIRRHVPASCRVIGVDDSPDMIAHCRANMARDHSGASVELRHEDLRSTTIETASIVVMNLTLQFIAPPERAAILSRIADGMVGDGALVLSEKISLEDQSNQAFMTNLHHEFKRYQGYSDLEIAQKRAALENVLIPETERQHIDRLQRAGFKEVRTMMRCMNFASFVALR